MYASDVLTIHLNSEVLNVAKLNFNSQYNVLVQ